MRELWTSLHNDSGRDRDAARQALILHYQPFANRVATKVHKSLPNATVDVEDVKSYALFGLIRSIETYDPDVGVTFEAYAKPRIMGAITDEMRTLDWAPRSLRRKARDIQRATNALEHDLGRPPTSTELAHELGTTSRDIERTINDSEASHADSIDAAPFDTGHDITPESLTVSREIHTTFIKALSSFPTRDRIIVALYYFEGLKLSQIATILGLPEQTVSKTHTRVMLSIRQKLSSLMRTR